MIYTISSEVPDDIANDFSLYMAASSGVDIQGMTPKQATQAISDKLVQNYIEQFKEVEINKAGENARTAKRTDLG